MIYYFSLLHILSGILAGISSLAIYFSYLKNRSKYVQKLILPFLSLTFYSFFAGLPIFFTNNLEYINLWFIASLVFIFFCIISAYQLPLFSENPKFSYISKCLVLVTTIIGILIITLEYFDLALPTINASGIIFWNMNPMGAFIMGTLALITGFLWGVLFLDGSRLVTDVVSRLKAYVLAGDGIIWGISVFLYFPSNNQTQTIISFMLTIISLLVTAFVFTLAHLQKKTPQ